ncbi:hypothetical protein [Actinoplanes sp. NPDC048796]|uniref:hypothetical protein n=1 Tax=Actinoplanes sp. NPDC048796 TaxID=3155640 RepID=UPI0033EB85F3
MDPTTLYRRARRYLMRRQAGKLLVEIERLDPDDLPPADTLAATLLAFPDELFVAEVRHWLAQPDLTAAPLPYRRVLTAEESEAWRTEVRRRWGVSDAGVWHPMLGAGVPPDVLVLDESMWDGEGAAEVRRVLRELGRTRVIELREAGDVDCLVEVDDDFAPVYTGAEGVWTDQYHDWIAYASHEWTVAFGGTLAARLREWPGAAGRKWRMWS